MLRVQSHADLKNAPILVSDFLDSSSNNASSENKPVKLSLVTGACKLGKVTYQCEDAYFITERGFGVADGVSGWNDYGFSSEDFAN